ncbi:PASTA domain-containing protein [Candidatus Solincola sp.]|nr:PASTA domain-containing protein [Actinomycetota bacterium]MDI7252879.1 PASTA domain-containing protein [Actinomycetota bacterium]
MSEKYPDWRGRVLRKRYRLDERIALGRTVEVFRGYDLLEEREVAVKLPLPHLLSDREFCDQFRAAAHRATRLRHPGLVRVLDYGLEEDRPFVVEELVEVRTLHEILETGKRMKPLGALYFALEISRTLAYLEKQGVAHGSLDERHIFIFPGRKAKISDPGFPVVMGAGESPFPVFLNIKRDIRDLGYLIYRSVTSRSKQEALEDARKGKLRWDREIPPRLQRFVEVCLKSAEGKGFATAEDALRDVVSSLREELPMAPLPPEEPEEERAEEETAAPTTPLPIPLPRLRRWQVWVGGGLLTVAAALLVLWLLSLFIGGTKVEVPNLVNASVEDAARMAAERDLGLLVVGKDYDARVKADYVISQDPKPGEMVKKKTVIKVLQSLGPLTVPNLVGLSLEDARAVLESRGFRVGEIAYKEVAGYSENRVVETDPPYGSKLSSGDAVNLVVNRKAQ